MDSKRVLPFWVLAACLWVPKVALAENLEVRFSGGDAARSGEMRIRIADDGQVQIKGDQLQVQTPGYAFRRSPYLERNYRYRRPDLSAWRQACQGQADTRERVYTQRSSDGSVYQRSSVVTRTCR